MGIMFRISEPTHLRSVHIGVAAGSEAQAQCLWHKRDTGALATGPIDSPANDWEKENEEDKQKQT